VVAALTADLPAAQLTPAAESLLGWRAQIPLSTGLDVRLL
jgi:hypothetical protein